MTEDALEALTHRGLARAAAVGGDPENPGAGAALAARAEGIRLPLIQPDQSVTDVVLRVSLQEEAVRVWVDERPYDGVGGDLFEAFDQVRLQLEPGLIRCLGTSLDVYPSGMCRDQGNGWVAYRQKPKTTVLRGIFDDDPQWVPATVAQQAAFCRARRKNQIASAWYRNRQPWPAALAANVEEVTVWNAARRDAPDGPVHPGWLRKHADSAMKWRSTRNPSINGSRRTSIDGMALEAKGVQHRVTVVPLQTDDWQADLSSLVPRLRARPHRKKYLPGYTDDWSPALITMDDGAAVRAIAVRRTELGRLVLRDLQAPWAVEAVEAEQAPGANHPTLLTKARHGRALVKGAARVTSESRPRPGFLPSDMW